jgi:hypothetical protein
MSNNRYTVWEDAYWNALGHGMSDAEAERHAAAKVTTFDKARANQRREAARCDTDFEGSPLVYADYL